MSSPFETYASFVSHHRRPVIVAVLVVTLVVGTGVTALDSELQIATFDIEYDSHDDTSYVDEHFVTDTGDQTIVVVRGDNVLSKDSLDQTLSLHEAIRENETVAPTLAEDRPTVDTATAFVEAALRSLGSFGTLELDDKKRTFGTFSAEEIETELPETLDDDMAVFGPGTSASTLLPADHDGSAEADTRILLVRHDDASEAELLESQRAIAALVEAQLGSESFVFGDSLVEERASDATGAVFAALGPFVFVLLVGLLSVLYRDPVDVVLAVLGIALVFLMTGGFVGWTGIEQTQLLVAVPWLLLGLAIDYGLHVSMRYRESRAGGMGPPRAMVLGLAGVIVALGVTTLTTASGFLSGVFGPDPIRDFGVVTAFGILATLLVFGAFVPAVKVELDRGTRDTPVSQFRAVRTVVGLGVAGAARAPVLVLVVALVLTAGGVVGATHVDTSVDRTDFYPDEPPDWLASVPGVDHDESAGELREQAAVLDERFEMIRGDEQVSLLIRGTVTEQGGIDAIRTIERETRDAETVRESEGVYTPFDVIEQFSEFDDGLAEERDRLERADDTGSDGNLTAAFDLTYDLAPEQLETVVHREGPGEYSAVRVIVPVESSADAQSIEREMRAVAELADDEPGVTVTATGQPISTAERQTALLETLIQSFIITLAVTFTLLLALFWLRYQSIAVGVVTVVPVLGALSWVLGTMALLGIPYNVETAIITGIAIGLGVDYAIHVSVRFKQETDGGRADDLDALSRSVESTGGTVFVSALTTALAVGVLLLTFIPSLQRFGLVMVLTAVYAFLAAVFVLPSLLLLQSRYTRW